MSQEKSWQEKASEKLPFGVQVKQASNDGPAQNLIFGTLIASALLQVSVLTDAKWVFGTGCVIAQKTDIRKSHT